MDIPSVSSISAKSIHHATTTTRGCLAAIKDLDILTDSWDPIIVFLLKNKLDFRLRDKWEEERKGSHTPATLIEFLKFLDIRQKVVISMPPRVKTTQPNTKKRQNIC